MTAFAGRTLGLVGALAAFPCRLAQREVARRGGQLRRGAQRGTTIVVFGRKGLARPGPERLTAERAAICRAGRQPMSESGFLRRLELLPPAPPGAHTRSEMLARTGLQAGDFDMLALFDGFECDTQPYSFRDLILGRKYAKLLADGADWPAIVRAVHAVPEVGALTALSLDVEARSIIARRPGWTGDLAGQGLLDIGTDVADTDAFFGAAEEAEDRGELDQAAVLYNRCLSIDPSDSIAAFNRANCLVALGRPVEAAHEHARAIRQDPRFVEARFNLAGLMADRGHPAAARRQLEHALEIDPDYADAAYNLAKLAFEAADHAAARHWWQRYIQLDATSDWAKRARNGLHQIALQDAGTGAG